MELKLKTSVIMDTFQALESRFNQQGKPPIVAFVVAEITSVLRRIHTNAETTRTGLVKKYSAPATDDQQQIVQVTPENRAAFMAEWEPLGEVELTIDVPQIPRSELMKMPSLEPFIVERLLNFIDKDK